MRKGTDKSLAEQVWCKFILFKIHWVIIYHCVIERWGEKCTDDANCKRVGVNAKCSKIATQDGSTNSNCDCSIVCHVVNMFWYYHIVAFFQGSSVWILDWPIYGWKNMYSTWVFYHLTFVIFQHFNDSVAFPQKWGERCSVDFSKQPQYGPCERGLVCELCPRTENEYRCHDYVQPKIGSASVQNFSMILYALVILFVTTEN